MKQQKQAKIVFPENGGGGCVAGDCPTVYQTEEGDFIFQGFLVEDVLIKTPENETVILLPKAFVEAFVQSRVKNDK